MQETTPDRFRKLFCDMVRRSDEDISLAKAALYIAGEEYPDLELSKYLETLDILSEEAAHYIGTTDDPRSGLQRLSEYLFVRQGFHGDQDNYYDPENSYLNRVLERKTGIPITLSIVYMEVGRRLGLILNGIGLPGHFILRHGPPEWDLYVDPFNEGRVLSKADCELIVYDMFGGKAQFREEFLLPCTKKQILVRMLTNVKHVAHHQGDYQRAIAALDRIEITEPGLGRNLKERASLNYEMRQYKLAIKDLELYLKSTPQAEDAEDIKNQIQSLWRFMATLN